MFHRIVSYINPPIHQPILIIPDFLLLKGKIPLYEKVVSHIDFPSTIEISNKGGMIMETNFILKNATIIDVEKGTAYKGAIEVNGGHIERVFSADRVLPPEKESIDVEGKYIIPGLIDMHCDIQEGFAVHFVASGVTTVRNTAGNV